MDKLNTTLKHVRSSIRSEIKTVKKLRGEKLATFKDIFNLDGEVNLYYNSYNLVIIDPRLHENLASYFKKDSLLLKLEIPKFNTYLWVYQYFNDQIFESYLVDSVKLPS